MFPRPGAVEQAGAVLEAAGLGIGGTGSINCTLQKTAELCTNGTAKAICQWNKAGVCSSLSAALQLETADPLGASPRLLNRLMLPYLLVTLATVLAVMVRHTPLWRLVRHVTPQVCNSFATRASRESVAERPKYSVALRSGLFGNIPATYDLQNLPPYDEVGCLDPVTRM